MPKPIIPVNPSVETEWLPIRQGLARLITSVAPTAIVYDRWPLKFEIGRTTELLTSTGDNGRIHAWIIGVHEAIPDTDRNGGDVLLWELIIRVWGFIGYQLGIDSDNPQNTIETECRKISQIVFKNRLHLTMDNTQALKDVGHVVFHDIDAQGFGRNDVIVAQGEMRVRLIEFL